MSYDRKEYRRDRFERKQAYRKEDRSKRMPKGKMSLEELERMEDEEEMEKYSSSLEEDQEPSDMSLPEENENPNQEENSDGKAPETQG